MTERHSKARQKFRALTEPSKTLNVSSAERQQWLKDLCEGFVQPSSANKAYYRVVVEKLWPKDSGVPGPWISEDDIRNAINEFRITNNFGKDPHKPYVDVFRRVRELQGEEGLIGVARQGKYYQLVDLKIGKKRVPRTKLSDVDWAEVKAKYNNKCASCGKKEPEVRLQQDHKTPRTRDGGDGTNNWQPLCDECNNFKSVACRGCELDCALCCWAFPEKFRPLRLEPKILEKIHSYCSTKDITPEEFLRNIILEKTNVKTEPY